jgi:hypothetical protein
MKPMNVQDLDPLYIPNVCLINENQVDLTCLFKIYY